MILISNPPPNNLLYNSQIALLCSALIPSCSLPDINTSTLSALSSNCLATSKWPLCGGLNLPGYNAIDSFVVSSIIRPYIKLWTKPLYFHSNVFTVYLADSLLSPLGVPTSPLLTVTIELNIPLILFLESTSFNFFKSETKSSNGWSML